MEPMNTTMNVADACQWKTSSMLYYNDRLDTFKYWPKQMKPDQYELTNAGFYYTGQYDKVNCFCCGLSVYAWEQKRPYLRTPNLFSPLRYIYPRNKQFGIIRICHWLLWESRYPTTECQQLRAVTRLLRRVTAKTVDTRVGFLLSH